MTVIPRSEIEKNLIKRGEIDWENREINWEYLSFLKSLDKQDGTSNFVEAMHVLKDKGLVSSNPVGNYFVMGYGIFLGPKLKFNEGYFTREEDAKKFQETFHLRSGLVAKIVS